VTPAPARRPRAAAPLAALLLLGAGASACSGSGAPSAAPAGRGGPPPQVAALAQDYQRAVLAHDWTAVCRAETLQARRGDTVEACAARTGALPNQPDHLPAVTAEVPLPVAASGPHPSGWAVATRHTVTEPGRAPYPVMMAVRVVDDAGTWRIDQYEDTTTADLRLSPHPAVAALLGGDRR
jgi:hypothetical protein